MGLISRVSSRTYRFVFPPWLHTNRSRSKRCSLRRKSRTDHSHSGLDSRPATRSGTTPSDDTGSEPSSASKSRMLQLHSSFFSDNILKKYSKVRLMFLQLLFL